MYQKKINKKAVCLMTMILSVAMIFCGCTSKEASPNGNAQPQEDNGPRINSPVEISYLIQNPIEVEEERLADDESNFAYTTLKVSGLSDKSLQKKVNERLKNVVNEMKGADLPAYRGVKAKFGENPELQSEYINSSVQFNSNNILSVLIGRTVCFEEGVVSEARTLNIDLNTGEDVALCDVFCDDVDYIEYINEQFYKKLNDSDTDEENAYIGEIWFSQTQPFKGISENQKFYISEYTGDVVLIIDQDNPEFETTFNYENVSIPVGDNAAYTKRFMHGDNIYEYDGPEMKRLIGEDLLLDVNEYSDSNLGADDNLTADISLRYSSQMPEELQKKAKSFKALSKEGIDRLNEVIGLYADDVEVEPSGNYERRVYADRINNFWYILVNDYISTGGWIYDPEGDAYNQDYITVNISNYHTYNPNTLKEMKLKDIFKTNTNVKKIVKNAMRKAVEENEELYDDELDDAVYDSLYEHITGFYPTQQALFISFGDILELLDENMVSADVKYELAYTLTELKYKNLGCDNLILFDY